MNVLKGEVSSSQHRSFSRIILPWVLFLLLTMMSDNEIINDVSSNKDVKHKTSSNDDTEDDQLRSGDDFVNDNLNMKELLSFQELPESRSSMTHAL
jgi:hypothetical protein